MGLGSKEHGHRVFRFEFFVFRLLNLLAGKGMASTLKGNIENMIGWTKVPLGKAGPLRLRSGQAFKDYYLPLATTEGALVASVNRGCKATRLAGGIKSVVE